MKLNSNILIVLLAVLLAGMMSGCLDHSEEETKYTLSNLTGYMQYHLKEDALYPHPVECGAYDGVYESKELKVSFLILNFENSDNASQCLTFLEDFERRNPEIHVALWRKDNVVFLFWSEDRDALENIVEMHKIISVDEPEIYLERADLSIGGYSVPAFQIIGKYSVGEGSERLEINVFEGNSHAKLAYDDAIGLVNRMYLFKLRLNENELNGVREACADGSTCLPKQIIEQTENKFIYTTMDNTIYGLVCKDNLLFESRFTGVSEEEIKNILSKYEV